MKARTENLLFGPSCIGAGLAILIKTAGEKKGGMKGYQLCRLP